MSKKVTIKGETKLEKAVARWLNAQAREYDSGVSGVMRDLMRGDCASSMVAHLIYTTDAARYYRRHMSEIDRLYTDMRRSSGEPITLRGWDDDDPLAREDRNQGVLAWFGFEETARSLALRHGIDY